MQTARIRRVSGRRAERRSGAPSTLGGVAGIDIGHQEPPPRAGSPSAVRMWETPSAKSRTGVGIGLLCVTALRRLAKEAEGAQRDEEGQQHNKPR